MTNSTNQYEKKGKKKDKNPSNRQKIWTRNLWGINQRGKCGRWSKFSWSLKNELFKVGGNLFTMNRLIIKKLYSTNANSGTFYKLTKRNLQKCQLHKIQDRTEDYSKMKEILKTATTTTWQLNETHDLNYTLFLQETILVLQRKHEQGLRISW